MFKYAGLIHESWEPSDTPASREFVEEICAASRLENRAAARRLAAVWELFELRRQERGEATDYAVDTWAAVGAEVAAALRISLGAAGSMMHYARALGERLPKVAAVFGEGDIDFRTVQTIVFRTDLMEDAEALAIVDWQLAIRAPRWPSMTQGRLGAEIDRLVGQVDKDAVRRRPDRVNQREVTFWDAGDGLAGVDGRLYGTDATALDKRLDALAATVCEHDPRTRDQRRADALGALAAGAERLACRCGRADCAAAPAPAPSPVVIHIIADAATVAGNGDRPGLLVGPDQLIPPELITELAQQARLRPLIHPADTPPEPGYTPSAALADFVRYPGYDVSRPGL